MNRNIARQSNAFLVEVNRFFMPPFPFDCSEREDGFEGYIKLYPLICTLQEGSPEPSARKGVHDSLSWVAADSLSLYDMSLATRRTLQSK